RVTSKGYPLDEKFEIWGTSPYFTVELSSTVRLSDLLRHLYVLLPVLDNQKHYWIGDAEVEKLLQKGKDWLKDHPERNLIVNRYLKYQAPLRYKALEKLMEEEGDDPDEKKILEDREEQKLEKKLSLNEQRMNSVIAVLKSQNVKSIIDLGCGEGRLIKNLRKYHEFKKITGMDISYQALTSAKKRLDLDRMPSTERARIQLIHGSLIYKDDRIKGFDAATCIEVIEHLDPFKLEMFEKILFGEARPETIIITTPNSEYNVKFNIPGRFRHRDHRFEWTREEFREWARPIAERYGYTVRFLPIGPEDPVVGAPTQMGVFSR
ncbi:3' terminal RNA ribose 2'-O-methyltransferase Hen1, partial [Candidatus Parcubacteria bacterium]